MCVGIPAKIIAITPGVLPMARVLLNGEELDCQLAYFPEAQIGDYVLLQNGFVMDVLDPQAAADSLAAFAELGVIELSAEAG
ncbi:MAG: HypC/HybG/HupF family hydrogenase formation chaperone [Actinobacteria bacterium HGW-Actinobacteria-2]|nr:MAG: HypC/HybG/HupF family hydrogenase formation chaperone [Actinobacteria bacterium HGW-Actinobacteria-2]